tara:strand:+ start:592 stop:894 length:303 start_codon:yes stop_codon:yes gene_type:complete
MKVCLWFGVMAVNYKPPGNQLLMCDSGPDSPWLLQGIGCYQSSAPVTECTIGTAEDITGLCFDDVPALAKLRDDTKLWVYDDSDGDGCTALFIDLEDLTR